MSTEILSQRMRAQVFSGVRMSEACGRSEADFGKDSTRMFKGRYAPRSRLRRSLGPREHTDRFQEQLRCEFFKLARLCILWIGGLRNKLVPAAKP